MKQFILASGLALTVMVSGTLQAEEREWREFVKGMAMIVASEDYCKLEFTEQGLKNTIASNIDSADTEFFEALKVEIFRARQALDKMAGKSNKIVHCVQVKRVANHHKILKK